jgi:type II restriction/modification system DNA methylase subunit YeeA
MSMTPQEFIHKWRPAQLRERQASQEHFIDLCRLLGEPTPAEIDSKGNSYCFDYGAAKTGGGDGFADVWKKGCFGWEYKGKHKDLIAAYAQLKDYVDDLQNPPLLIVSDMDRIVIRTNFTNTVQVVHTISLDDLVLTDKRRLLKWAFSEPEHFRPEMSREELTETAARQFSELAQRLRDRQYEPLRVAHFMIKMLFCMFAEHINILPSGIFQRLLEAASRHPRQFQPMAKDLFSAMGSGGRFGAEMIDWFNGGLFDNDDTLELEKPDIDQLLKISQLDWSAIEPSIFGTLFERGLDPGKRSQLGAHFTDQQSILRIVEPVVLAPLRAEWEAIKVKLSETMAEYRQVVERPGPAKTDVQPKFGQSKKGLATPQAGRSKAAAAAAANRLHAKAKNLCREFLYRLENFRVLDPACGSGNFLYLSLLGLKDLEHSVIMEAEELGLERFFPAVGPQSVMGIEINLYAAELARVTIWIGQIQWMLRHGWGLSKDPILKPLDQISCRDAILNPDGTEAEWPAADCIVGNPPFLGSQKMISELDEDYVTALRDRYNGRVPGGADLVTYWFDKAWKQIEAKKSRRAGLVATNSIRGGQNRKVLDAISAHGRIFEAWSDEPWILEGAAVRVSIVCFSDAADAASGNLKLDGQCVAEVYPDLTSRSVTGDGVNLTRLGRLDENRNICFQGPVKVGSFNVPGDLARTWLLSPNPHGRPNSDVVRPWRNGRDLTHRGSDKWIIDFGSLSLEGAELYEAPFKHVLERVKPKRDANREKSRRDKWWLLGRSAEDLRTGIAALPRFLLTPRVAKYRLFVWVSGVVLPDSAVVAVAKQDDTCFGILQSRFHEAWALRTCTWLGVGNDPRYTPSTTFETFPFPCGLTPNMSAEQYTSEPRAVAIAEAGKRLNELRENWLNPTELVRAEPEVVPGCPDRIVPVNEKAAQELKKRTLTNLYNERPSWLAYAHQQLDEAVAAAYGWPADISEEEALKKLLELNLSRSA